MALGKTVFLLPAALGICFLLLVSTSISLRTSTSLTWAASALRPHAPSNLSELDTLAITDANPTEAHASDSNSSLSASSAAANETLGFATILALSRGTEWRLHGLHAAAAYTGLVIDVPRQPFVSPNRVDAFTQAGAPDSKKPSRGSARAWLAHLDILRHIVQSDYSTALIVEDDIDWAVEIKQQMTTLADKVREYTDTPASNPLPYGSDWDVLWLGHCGEWYTPEHSPHILSWEDATAGARQDWRGIYDAKWLADLPEGQRHLFWSVSPICTYAYAVSAAGAQKILEWASDGQAEAYDIHLAAGCMAGRLRCLSVVDQLFHHHRPAPEYGQGSDILLSNGAPAGGEAADLEQAMGSTAVILHSARCQAMFGTTCRDTSTASERPYR